MQQATIPRVRKAAYAAAEAEVCHTMAVRVADANAVVAAMTVPVAVVVARVAVRSDHAAPLLQESDPLSVTTKLRQ